MVEVTLTLVKDIVTIVGVIAGFTYYVLTVQATRKNQKHQLETRQAQLFMQIFSLWNNKDFWRDYNDIMNADDPTPDQYTNRYDDPEMRAKWLHVGGLFEGVGSLLHKGFINPVIVSDYARA